MADSMDLQASLLGTINRYALSVEGVAQLLDIFKFEATDMLNEGYCYKIEFTCSDKSLSPDSLLLKDASFIFKTPIFPNSLVPIPPQIHRTQHGVITQFAHLSTSADESHYAVTLEPHLSLLRNSRRSAIYQGQSIPEVIEKVLYLHGYEGWEYSFNLKGKYPKRELVTQWGQTDFDFIQSLLSEEGIWLRFDMNDELDREVLFFGDDQQFYEFNTHLPVRPESGLSDNSVECVWQLSTAHQVVSASTKTKDYNYRDANNSLITTASIHTEGDITTGDQYKYADNYLKSGAAGSSPEIDSGAFYARLAHERELNKQNSLHGCSSSVALRTGQMLEIEGDIPAAFADGILLTSISSSGSRKGSLAVAFSGIPYSENVGFRPALKPRPRISGTIPARVTSVTPDDVYAHLDEFGRYRVKFDFDLDDWKTGYESLWVRLAKPYSGDVYGFHFPLIEGCEVGIAFDEGHVDRPYIAYAMHDSVHVDHVTQENNKRNILRTPANNKLRLDDERSKEHIKLATEYGKSQLSLGHIVDSARNKRGEGFELRSDDWGAIRAGKGLFITADEQGKAQGKVLDMEPAISHINQANSEMQALNDAAVQATALASDIHTQLDFVKSRLNQLQGAAILLSAPQGIALTSGEHTQLSATQNLMVNAGKNADIGAIKNLCISAGQAFSAFVQKMGMKLIANQGKVVIQAQNDAMELIAKQGLTITSTDDEIIITSPKKITLNGGGSYLTLDPNKIEHGGAGDFTVKCQPYTVKIGGASLSSDKLSFDKSELKETKPGFRTTFSS